MITPHEIAMASRCQMIVGSYEGATRTCSCVLQNECKLKDCCDEKMTELKSHPFVQKAIEKNKAEYLRQKGIQ